MELRPFGDPGRRVPVLGLGTWNMERDDRASAIAALRRGIELGMTHLDTAEMYGSGQVEAIRRRDPSLGDALLDLLAFLRRLAADIQERWLTKPCELLESVDDGVWWGPVRDITPTLRHFRR